MQIFLLLLEDVVVDLSVYDGKGGWDSTPADGKAGWDRYDGKAGW